MKRITLILAALLLLTLAVAGCGGAAAPAATATSAPVAVATTAPTVAPTVAAVATMMPTTAPTTAAATSAATKPATTAAAGTAVTAVATKPAASAGVSGTLAIAGSVTNATTYTLDQLKALGATKATLEHPKSGPTAYDGVKLSVIMDKAQVKADATKVVLTAADGFTSELALADVKKSTDAMVTWGADGKLGTAMPGLPGNAWAKDLVKIEFK